MEREGPEPFIPVSQQLMRNLIKKWENKQTDRMDKQERL